MKYTIEIPDDEADFVLQVIRRLSSAIKLTPSESARAAKPQDETEYLMRSRVNRERLLAAMDEVERGQTQPHDLIEP